MTVRAFGAYAANRPLEPIEIFRRAPSARDVQIEIAFCGVCHSDLHTVRSEWSGTSYPCVPGHEIVGRVSAVGAEVTRFKEGDLVGVGCIVDSCGVCASCTEHLEQYCEQGMTGTYNSMIGGIAETQEMLDFCAEKGIVADIELIRIQQIEGAYARMLKSDVKYRFVIDNESLAG